MTNWRKRQQRVRSAARGTLWLAKSSARAAGAASRTTRSATSATLRRGLGTDRYRREVDDLVQRLTDALAELHSVLEAREREVEQLRAEIAELRSARK